jgi:hypothetical protein
MKKMKRTKLSNTPDIRSRDKVRKRLLVFWSVFVVITALFGTGAWAETDPIAVVNNLSDFMFSLIRAIGMILLGFGIVQIGLSLKSHDAAQRANGFMTFAGGLVITFAKEILNLITGS